MASIGRLGRFVHSSQFRSFCTKPPAESPLKSALENAALYDELRVKSEWASQPYAHLPPDRVKAKNDPIESTIILFPGQGTQYLGMGKKLFKYPGVKEIYDCASEVAGFDLKNIETQRDLDKYCQMAIVTASLATVEQIRENRPTVLPSCVAAAGFSLGEITALIFAGAMSLEEGLKVVHIRNLAMEAASKDHPGGMMTIMFQADANISLACQEAIDYSIKNGVDNAVCNVANYLYPHCKVISGSKKALEFLEQNGSNFGIRRTKRLDVIGPFHSEAMRPAVEPFRQALKYCKLHTPKIPVYNTIKCEKYHSPREIVSILPKQIVNPVKWEQLMQALYNRRKGNQFPRTYEVGPGQGLRAILRKVNAPAWDNSLSIFE